MDDEERLRRWKALERGGSPLPVVAELENCEWVTVYTWDPKRASGNVEDLPSLAHVSISVHGFSALRSLIELVEAVRVSTNDEYWFDLRIVHERDTQGCCDFKNRPEEIGVSWKFGDIPDELSDEDFEKIAQAIVKYLET